MSSLKEFIKNNGRPYLIGHGIVDVAVSVNDMRTQTADGTDFVFDHKGVILRMNKVKQTWQHPTLFVSIKEAMTFLATLKDANQMYITPLKSIVQIGSTPYMFLGLLGDERLFSSLTNGSITSFDLATISDLKPMNSVKMTKAKHHMLPSIVKKKRIFDEATEELKAWEKKQLSLLTAVKAKKKLYSAGFGYVQFEENKHGDLVANIKNTKSPFTIELICNKDGHELVNDVDDPSTYRTVFHDQNSLIKYNKLKRLIDECVLRPLETRIEMIEVDDDYEDEDFIDKEQLLFLGSWENQSLFFSETTQLLKVFDISWYVYKLLQPNLSLKEKGIVYEQLGKKETN